MPHIQAAPFSHMPLLVRGYAQLGDPEIRRITAFSGIFHGNAALLHAQIYILVRVFNEQWDFAFRLAVKPLNPDALQIAAPRAQSADIRPSRGIRSIGYHPMFIGGSGGPWRGRGGNASDTPVGQGTPLVIGTPPDIFNIGISGWSKEQKKKRGER